MKRWESRVVWGFDPDWRNWHVYHFRSDDRVMHRVGPFWWRMLHRKAREEAQ